MPTPHTCPRPDFDSWANLARENPQAFEQQRLLVIEQAIQAAPYRLRQRLRCLQWKLDRIRATTPNPLAASVRMQQLLWESVAGPRGLLATLQAAEGLETSGTQAPVSATLLEFRRQRSGTAAD